MTRSLVLFVSCAAVMVAQSGIGLPYAGCVRDAAGAVRPVYGTAGILMPGEAVQHDVISAACSEQAALLKTADALELRDGALRLMARWPAPEGPARFAFAPNGAAAWVYFWATRELKYVDARRGPVATALSEALAGEVLSIANVDAQHIAALVRTGGRVSMLRLSLAHGGVDQEIPLPEITGPAMLVRDGTLVYGDHSELVLSRPNHAAQRFALPAPASAIYAMSERTLGISFTNGAAPAVLRMEPGHERVLRVPEARK